MLTILKEETAANENSGELWIRYGVGISSVSVGSNGGHPHCHLVIYTR